MVRLRVSKEGRARRVDARWTRIALVRLDAYRRECILVHVGKTEHRSGQRRGAVTRLRSYAISTQGRA